MKTQMRLLIVLLLFSLGACSSSNSQVSDPEPPPKVTESEPSPKAKELERPPNYCFENETTRTVVRLGIIGFAIWAAPQSPDIVVNVFVGALIIKGFALIFPDFGEAWAELDDEANQALCEL